MVEILIKKMKNNILNFNSLFTQFLFLPALAMIFIHNHVHYSHGCERQCVFFKMPGILWLLKNRFVLYPRATFPFCVTLRIQKFKYPPRLWYCSHIYSRWDIAGLASSIENPSGALHSANRRIYSLRVSNSIMEILHEIFSWQKIINMIFSSVFVMSVTPTCIEACKYN